MLASILRTIVVYVAVIFAMRLMGKRQLGELQPAELVTTFLISNVASICIEEPELPILSSLVPILLIASLEILNSSAAWFFPKYARLIFGQPITVIRDGVIDQHALSELRITAGDLMEALRGEEVFTPEDVSWGVIETNGTLSLAQAPAANETPPMLPLLIDRHLYRDNLTAFSLDERWLKAELARRGLQVGNVLLFLYDGKNAVVIKKEAAQKERPHNG